MRLPGGFSPTQALHTVADKANPFDGTDTDYDVFSDYSVRGGDRSPANGSFIGPQVQGASTTVPSAPTGGGGVTGGSTPVYTTDPYAAFGGKAAFDAKRNTFGVTQGNYAGGARQSLTDVGNTYDAKNNAFVNDIETGQGDVNRGFAGNELNLRRSMQNIVRGIQSGIRSGGVALAGMNASDSGAADAMSRAYAKVGNTQTGEARGQAATEAEELQRQQGQLNTKRAQGEADLGTYRDTETGRVRGDFSGKLDALDANAQAGGFGGVVDKSLVDQVLGEALSRLTQIDQSRGQRLAGVQQWSPDEIMREAIRLDELGAAGNAFQVTGPEVVYGGGGQMTGAPMGGELPIYMKGKDQGLATIPITRTKQDQPLA